MLKKSIKKIFLSFIVTLLFVSFNVSFANITEEKLNNQFSDRYKQWLELSDEEKANTKMPRMYDFEYISMSKNARTIAKSSILNGITKYNLNDHIGITIKDQQNTNSCWAFGIISSLETNLALKGEILDFSERHIEYATSKTFSNGNNLLAFNREVGDGGFDLISVAYMARGLGPVLEEDMPFENNENKIPLENLQNKNAIKKLDEFIFFPNIEADEKYTEESIEIRNKIKEHIIQHGAVTSSMRLPQTQLEATEYVSKYYNNQTAAWFYNGNKAINHEVSIIGWDDNYGVENFCEGNRPTKPGAYIVRNSHGEEAYDNGYQYVSYEDAYIEVETGGVTKLSNINYDSIYVHDELGMSSSFGPDIDTGYAINVFDRDIAKNEELTEVGLYFVNSTNYEIYVNSTDGSLVDNKFTKVKTGSYTNGFGYTTVKLDTPIKLTGNKFAIKVKYVMPGSQYVVPLEVNLVGIAEKPTVWDVVSSKAGQSYVYSNGMWEDLKMYEANACIKAFTKNTEEPALDTNNFLSNLTINNGTLTPVFNKNTANYTVTVENEIANVIIGATLESNKATFENGPFPKTVNLNVGANTIEIKTKAEDGTQKTYTVRITRASETEEELTSTTYVIDDEYFIKNISPNTNVIELLQNLEYDSEIKIYNKDDEQIVGQTIIGTGMKIKLDNGTQYDIIITGDADGDGLYTLVDFAKMKLQIVNLENLTGASLKALDVNFDGEVTVVDYAKCKQAIVNLINF